MKRQAAIDSKQTMADGLIHRPDGRIIDATSNQVVSGANINTSAGIDRQPLKTSALIQASQANEHKSQGTILDASDNFEVRTFLEK